MMDQQDKCLIRENKQLKADLEDERLHRKLCAEKLRKVLDYLEASMVTS